MAADKTPPDDKSRKDLASWFAGRRGDVERWVDETCQRAISRTRGVLADEIRGLSRRVERMHELLDQLEHYVDSPDMQDGGDKSPEEGSDEATRKSS